MFVTGISCFVFTSEQTNAAEGAFSNYFPGAYGSLLPGVAPKPGWVGANLNLLYGGKADRAVLQGRLDIDVKTTAFYSLLQGLHVLEAPMIGGYFAMGGYVPLGYASLESSLGSLTVSNDEFALGDVGIIPASFYWNTGNFNFNLYELIIAPTGQYNLGASVNIGRNYWSFDTVLALTWFNAESGTEISVVPGLMFNTANPDTNYRTGTEFHVDFMLNQFLSDTFAIGFHGFAYTQISGDSKVGALLGGFKGEAVGIGPAFSWIPKSGGGNLAITGKWLHDIKAKNRISGDYGIISLSMQF